MKRAGFIDGLFAALRTVGAAGIIRASGLVWVLLVMCVAAALISDAFLNPFNLINVARQVALFGIVSIGMTFVILTAGIDLSVGSIVAVTAVVSALMLNLGVPIPLVLLGGLAIGVALGGINGLGITLGRLPPFIMTLGMMVMGRGLAMTISDGHPIHFQNASADFAWLGQGYFLGLPVPVWIFAVVAAVAYVVLRYTPFGRNIYAVGSNPEAARLAGINVPLTIFAVYVISGFLSSLTALIFVSRLTVGEPVAGVGLELEAIAVTVIGGTSLFGGEGGIVGTVIGAAIFAVLANLLNLAGVSPFTQQIVKGAIIVVAVLFEMHRRRRIHSAP
jgi:ribose/xylose/arabinose/galactoside ABC-type transport system permease subunit